MKNEKDLSANLVGKYCGYQCTKNRPREYPIEKKLEAVKLLKDGVSFRGIPRLLSVSFLNEAIKDTTITQTLYLCYNVVFLHI